MFNSQKLFSRWRSRWRSLSLKQRLCFFAGALVSLFGLYFLGAFLAVNPAEVRLAELKNSWQAEKICHEDCSLKRRQAVETIIKSLTGKPDSRLAKRLQNYFLDEEAGAEFRSELVAILRRAFGPDAPPYIKSYLADSEADPVIQAAIIASYGGILGSEEENSSPDYYFTLLTGDYHPALKQEAIKLLSDFPNKEKWFSLKQLEAIESLIVDSATEKSLRQSLVLLLSDYYPLFSEETAVILKTAYNAENGQDEISRAFAADILNKLGGEELAPVAVSPAAWEEYYNN
jgi:hypothetical protein